MRDRQINFWVNEQEIELIKGLKRILRRSTSDAVRTIVLVAAQELLNREQESLKKLTLSDQNGASSVEST